ncbi:MAG: ABC transporter permease [Muribaculaceae bacterium]|nr:ABC transporter permease [Muribaculaceae bacterium]
MCHDFWNCNSCIALIGLIGYTGDEIQRRSKEIAIRKVTGASSEKILLLFLRNIVIVAFPSLVGGGCMAMIIGRRWLSQFSDQVSLSPFSMLLCVMVLLLMIIGVAAFNTIGVAGSNPINHLRNE